MSITRVAWWCIGSVSDWWLLSHWFNFWSVHCQIITLGKLVHTHVFVHPSSLIWPVAGKP